MCKFPSHKVAHYRESHRPLLNEVIWANIKERLFGLALQSNRSNCLVIILHRQFGTYLLSSRAIYSPTGQQTKILYYISHCLTFTNNMSPTHKDPGQHTALNTSTICCSDKRGKYCLVGLETIGPVIYLQDGCQGNTSHQSCSTSDNTSSHMYFIMHKTFFTQELIILAHTASVLK